jgi:hypothetical protein
VVGHTLPCTVIAFSSHNDSSHISSSTTVIQCSQPQFTPSCWLSCQGILSVPFDSIEIVCNWAVPWLRRLIAGLSPRRPGFDSGSVHVGFVVDKVALGQVFLRVLRFSPVSFIPPVLHYTEKLEKVIIILIIITGLHNKPQGCGASVASAAGPFTI